MRKNAGKLIRPIAANVRRVCSYSINGIVKNQPTSTVPLKKIILLLYLDKINSSFVIKLIDIYIITSLSP